MTTPARSSSHAVIAISMAGTGMLCGAALVSLHGNRMAPWILGRATGVCAYLLLTAVVGMGLVMAHPTRRRGGGTTPSTVRLHIALVLFTAVFTAGHIFVLATDKWAGVGARGALVPLGSSYRPWPVTLGLIAVWVIVLAGASAGLAGRLPARVWWPMHRFSTLSFVLVWLHGVLTGADSVPLRPLYILTGAGLLVLAVTRHLARRGDESRHAGAMTTTVARAR